VDVRKSVSNWDEILEWIVEEKIESEFATELEEGLRKFSEYIPLINRVSVALAFVVASGFGGIAVALMHKFKWHVDFSPWIQLWLMLLFANMAVWSALIDEVHEQVVHSFAFKPNLI
jgi:hypothetical protein